jgi:RluA family pseudouridine synthase
LLFMGLAYPKIGLFSVILTLKVNMPDETVLQSKVPQNLAGQSLLDYLSNRFRYQTRETWETLIRSGKVTVNQKKVSPELLLQKGDQVAYSVVLKEPPVDGNIQILHEENSFLVAAKPGQLPSHADGNFIKNTFIFLITEELRKKGWEGDVRLVHRLDRETSGLMVLAKNKEANLNLVRQFEQGQVEKEYQAVVKGQVEREKFEVNGAIGKDSTSSISVRQKVVPEGTPYSKPSLTHFEKIKDLDGFTLLRCIPKTGRTNQIRVHLDSIGHPIVGDKLYGRTDEQFLEFIRHVKSGGDPAFSGHLETPRHFLHAGKLCFVHPITGNRVTFQAELPLDMREFIEKN